MTVTAVPTHPLGPLTAAEITASTDFVRKSWPAETLFQFKVVTLKEPAKAELVPYLTAERAGTTPLPVIARRVFLAYYIRNTDKFHEAVVNLSEGKLESNIRLGPDKHANGDGEEIIAIEKIVLEDPEVLAAIAKLKLPEGAVVVTDPWIYGSDGVNEGLFRDDRRVMQCFMYMRDPANSSAVDSCHYAFPLPVSPVIDCVTHKIVRIDIMPTGLDTKIKTIDELEPWQPAPPSEYVPEAIGDASAYREDLKPLRVVQPEGASFKVEEFSEMGRRVTWQKWDMKVGFNQREGMVLYDVHYDGLPLFYRLSLSDMAIPYADPRHPFHKKQAFDLGDVGAGIMANNLQLGCDCLGSIYYMSGVLSNAAGEATPFPNVICMHEQDAGIAWKHTNYRTERAVVVRQREFVLQTILTVSNYEYILAWVFNLSGDITYEVRATGIVSTQPIDRELEKTAHPFGTVVHPGVLAGHHQHFFSLRVDPMILGHGNTVVYQDSVAIPRDPVLNPHGVGYTVKSTPLTKSGFLDMETSKTGRVLHITNQDVRHPVNGLPASYKVHLPSMQPILADTESFHYRRAEFADHPVYVTRYAEDELYAGGTWTNQSRGGDGVRSWAKRDDDLVQGDPVVWLQFGLNHVPRAEDFPVMPCEMLRVTLRPANVFVKNPSLDVPPSSQAVNCSVSLNGVVDKEASCCA